MRPSCPGWPFGGPRFTDVEFEVCDLANVTIDDGLVFNTRVAGGRLTGARWTSCGFRNVLGAERRAPAPATRLPLHPLCQASMAGYEVAPLYCLSARPSGKRLAATGSACGLRRGRVTYEFTTGRVNGPLRMDHAAEPFRVDLALV
jgi:hypothetical protein